MRGTAAAPIVLLFNSHLTFFTTALPCLRKGPRHWTTSPVTSQANKLTFSAIRHSTLLHHVQGKLNETPPNTPPPPPPTPPSIKQIIKRNTPPTPPPPPHTHTHDYHSQCSLHEVRTIWNAVQFNWLCFQLFCAPAGQSPLLCCVREVAETEPMTTSGEVLGSTGQDGCQNYTYSEGM